jgi:hypothetical protein
MVAIGELVVLTGGGGGGGAPAVLTTDIVPIKQEGGLSHCLDCTTASQCHFAGHCLHPQRAGRKPQRLSMVAALMCGNRDFQRYIGADSAEVAAHWMRTKLNIESRSELDNPERAELIERFHRDIRRPFASSSYSEVEGYVRA